VRALDGLDARHPPRLRRSHPAPGGVHEANRLASNSLTECFVFGARAAQAAVTEPHVARRPPVPDWRFTPPNAQTREAMWRLAGPRRRGAELEQLLDDPYPLARLTARVALSRHESRGAHQRSDFPQRDPSLDGIHLVVDGDDRLRRETWP